MGGKIQPVILSGGSGTRLWPLSRKAYPKHLLPLASRLSLLQETVKRVAERAHFAPPILVCNEEYRFAIAEQLREIAVEPRAIVLEPLGRNTAPAVTVAALMLAEEDADALMLVLPSDHVIADQAAFLAALETAARAAEAGAIVTFGMTPTEPETGYGYIRAGEALGGAPGAFRIARFTEKPDRSTAEGFLAEGGYYWNSGMFLFRVRSYLAELERLAPPILAGCRAALAASSKDLGFLRLGADAFARIPATSIDYAVMERTAAAAVVPAQIGWSDVGSWSSLWSIGSQDAAGNVLVGDVLARDVSDSYIRADGRLVAAIGIEGLVVVATEDALLLAPRARAQEVKEIVERLERDGRSEAIVHRKVHRPWGSYQQIDAGPSHQVKRITVKPGAKLSLQRHAKRAEHWTVVRGEARVTIGDKVFALKENEFDLRAARLGAPPREPRRGPARHHRGADRELFRRGRHRAARGRLRALTPARAARPSSQGTSGRFERSPISLRECARLVPLGAASRLEHTVVRMRAEHGGEAARHLDHQVRRAAIETIDPLRKVERRLHRPYLVMLAGRQDARRVADGDPADRHGGTRRQPGAQMYGGMRAHFRPLAKISAVKDCGSRRDEYLILQHGACDMGIGADQTVVADRAAVAAARAHHGVFHHDAVASDPDGAARLADEARPVHDAGAGADRDIAA